MQIIFTLLFKSINSNASNGTETSKEHKKSKLLRRLSSTMEKMKPLFRQKSYEQCPKVHLDLN